VYVHAEHRRRGLARQLVDGLLEFAKADRGYRSVYLHMYPPSPGAMKEVPRGGSGVVHFETSLV
jgi:GNAT superfamily N-acetyltransferase